MSAHPLLTDLCAAYAGGELVVFVGAGVSAAAGIPAWDTLTARLIVRARAQAADAATVREAESYAAKGQLVDALSALQLALGAQEWAITIEGELDDRKRDLPDVVRAIACLAPRLRAVLTTNLDHLLERGFGGAWVPLTRAPGDIASKRGYILKAHGTLLERSSWVFSRAQYDQAMFRSPEMHAAFDTIYRAFPILFIGCGLADDDLERTLGAVRAQAGSQPPQHFALLAEPVPPFRRRRLEDAGLRLLTYDNENGGHAAVPELLRRIAGGLVSGPAVGHVQSRLVPTHGSAPELAAHPDMTAGAMSTRRRFDTEIYTEERTIARGHYGDVTKCRRRDTDEVCIVKRTREAAVSMKALEALASIRCSNIAAPRRVWREAGYICEELPYVGGTRVSDALLRGFGGLRGAVLKALLEQFENILNEMHTIGVVHRDIHPENIYLVIDRPSETATVGEPINLGSHLHETRMFSYSHPVALGKWREGGEFGIRFVLVDTTFAVRSTEAHRARPVMHGSFTPEDQLLGRPSSKSDLYAFGATVYFGITGREVPLAHDGGFSPKLLADVFHGHPSLEFPTFLAGLLERAPSKREWLPQQSNTTGSHDCGMLSLSDGRFIACDTFDVNTRIIERDEALALWSARLDRAKSRCASLDGTELDRRLLQRLHDEAVAWVARLKSPPSTAQHPP